MTDTLYSTTAQFQILRVPTSSNGTTYGPGTNKQVLKTNGTSTYWGADEVLQESTTTNAAYEILFSASANNNTVTESTKKTLTLTYNPSTKVLTNGTITLNSDSATIANATAYDILTLGNSINVSSTTEHSEGKINLYSAGTKAHIIVGKTTTTNDYTHTLPNQTGLLVTLNGIPSNDIGSSTQPIYITSEGVVSAGSSYGGGTLVTLNNTSKAASTASFYAPTTGGTKNTQALVGDGENVEPKWVNISPSITITAGDANNTPKINVTVLGQSGAAQSITTATTSVYGATKLTNSYTSTDESLAVTGKALLAALETLDSSLPSGSAVSKTLTGLTITNGKLTAATFSDISIAASQINSVIPVDIGGTGVTSYPALDAELKTVAIDLSDDTNPFTLDPGTYYLASTTYNTDYYPQATLVGTMIIHQIGETRKTATIIDSARIFYGFGDSTSDTVFNWYRTLQAYDESAIYRFTLKDSDGVNGIQLIKDTQGGKLYLYGKDGHIFWFDSYTDDAPLRLVTMGTDSNYKIWQFTRAGNTVLPGTLSIGAQNTTDEGGEIALAAAPDYNNNAVLDIYQSNFRIVSGGASRFILNLTDGKITTGLINGLYSTPISTDSSIATTKTAVYTGSGSGWTGSESTMQYAAILHVGEGMSRGFDIWAPRAGKLYWRAGNSDMTAWLAGKAIIDTDGGDIVGHTIFSTPTPGLYAYSAAGSAIEIREVNRVAGNQTDWTYAPKIGFHWSSKAALQLGMDSAQWLQLYNNNSTTHGNMAVGKIILDQANALRFVGGSSTTKSMLFRNDGSDFWLLCCNSAADGDNFYTPTCGSHPWRVNLLSGISYIAQVSITKSLFVAGNTTIDGGQLIINNAAAVPIRLAQGGSYTSCVDIVGYANNTDSRFCFRQSNSNRTVFENYLLPSTSPSITTSATYNIFTSKNLIPIVNGGTGVNSASFSFTNQYSTLLAAINAAKSRIFPISIQKAGSSAVTDLPSGFGDNGNTDEFSAICIGDSVRCTVLLFHFPGIKLMYYRCFYNGDWGSVWEKIGTFTAV